MKLLNSISAKLTVLFLSLFTTLLTFAQEGGGSGGGTDINVDINKGGGGGNWYAQPWIWIVGAAVFILLLVALLRGNNTRTDA